MFDKIKALFSGNRKEPEKRDDRRSAPVQDRKSPEEAEVRKSSDSHQDHRDGPSTRPEESRAARMGEAKPARLETRMTADDRSAKGGSEEGMSAERKGRKPADRKKDSGRDLYRYLNQAIKTMHIRYSEGRFDELSHLGKVPATVMEDYDKIVAGLPDDEAAWLSALRTMIVLREEEGVTYADIADKEGLKKEFLNAMLPFYGTYAGKLGEGRVRFSSLIGPDMLGLFHELTGKKFSVGFHRRYESGINAFEWDKDRYQVYDSKGHMLCDAVFKDGAVDHGYAELSEPDPDFENWDIVKAGEWKDGNFQTGALRYAYRIKVQ